MKIKGPGTEECESCGRRRYRAAMYVAEDDDGVEHFYCSKHCLDYAMARDESESDEI
jgi:hypothetical protein